MTIFVVFFAPEHNWVAVCVIVGLGVAFVVVVAVAVPALLAVGVIALVELHWNDEFCDFKGASEILSDVWFERR